MVEKLIWLSCFREKIMPTWRYHRFYFGHFHCTSCSSQRLSAFSILSIAATADLSKVLACSKALQRFCCTNHWRNYESWEILILRNLIDISRGMNLYFQPVSITTGLLATPSPCWESEVGSFFLFFLCLSMCFIWMDGLYNHIRSGYAEGSISSSSLEGVSNACVSYAGIY
jgi:hypothetical protein